MTKNTEIDAETAATTRTDELAEVEWLADIGEIVGPVAHEFNNFLNTLLLQVAVLEMSAPEELKADLTTIRRQGREVAAVVKQVQQFRRRRRAGSRPADLNRAVAEAAAALTGRPDSADGGPRLCLADSDAEPEQGDVVLRLRLTEGLPRVAAGAPDLRRLCRFLAGGVAHAIASGGELTLATVASGTGLALRLEIAGMTHGSLARLLEGPLTSDGPQGLELAAGQSLVRRLNGTLRTELSPDGREALVVELPTARDK